MHGFPGYGTDEPVPTLREVFLTARNLLIPDPIRVDIVPGSQCAIQRRLLHPATTLIDLSRKSSSGHARKRSCQNWMGHSTYEQPLPKKLWPRAATGHRSDGQPVKVKWHTFTEMAPAGLWTDSDRSGSLAIELQNSKAGKIQQGAF